MKKAFVIGFPIKHSRSPLIHGYWLKTYGIEGSYEAIEVAPEALPAFFERLRTGEFAGGNVTVPHKEAAFRLCDIQDPETAGIGALNTLDVVSGADGLRIHGRNTDFYGFAANLDQQAPGWAEGVDAAVVLGAGGAARAVAARLAASGIGRTYILNRTPERAHRLARELGGTLEGRGLGDWPRVAPQARLVVNTTTVGMGGTGFEGLDLSLLPPDALVTDIVYTPLETPLLAAARARGLRTVDGLGMLLHQAVPGFESWFGVRPEVTRQLRQIVEQTL